MRKAYRFRPKTKEITPQYRVNERIRVPQVRLIDENGQMVGVMSTQEALRIAQERGYDLVEVVPVAQPPVVKLLDYGKFQYQQEKQIRKARAQVKKVEVKGVRLSLRIGQHDRDFRLTQAKEFLEDGDKVKIEIVLRGREHQHTDLAKEIIKKFVEDLHAQVPIMVEQGLSKQAGRLSMIIAPKPK